MFSTLTRNLNSKCVAADANKVVGHTLNRHSAIGQPHSKNALHLYSPVLPSLHLHCGSLERDGHLQPCLMSVAPAAQWHVHNPDRRSQRSAVISFHQKNPAFCHLRWSNPKALVPDDLGGRVSKGCAGERCDVLPPHYSDGSLCQWQENGMKLLFVFCFLFADSKR